VNRFQHLDEDRLGRLFVAGPRASDGRDVGHEVHADHPEREVLSAGDLDRTCVSVPGDEGVSVCVPLATGLGEGGLQLASRARARIFRAWPADLICDRPPVSLGG